ncbi:hypothetical protein AXG93_942s1170 [Marchantia polymorpha subsp. ruderalis]|uniref:Uncharacterized protein n=1 Tax=Marchantia polymorpha subsp. ruderalis TaxID=1480154 RepID=A0A176WC14_MARPO|nr:hypothetical protein AXG93_942s1170 [Marchantia polymorpha subsp. ruderalis]
MRSKPVRTGEELPHLSTQTGTWGKGNQPEYVRTSRLHSPNRVTDGVLIVGMELDERRNHTRMGQQWIAEAVGIQRPPRHLGNLGLEEGLRPKARVMTAISHSMPRVYE